MRFKLDENLPRSLADDLRGKGHEASTCAEEALDGAPDDIVSRTAFAERRNLLTFDLGFSDVRGYPPGTHPGIVVFRLPSQDIHSCREAAMRLLDNATSEEISGNLVIVEKTRIRIRRSESSP